MGEAPADAHSATLWAHLLRDTFLPCLWADRRYSSKDPTHYPPNWQSREQGVFTGGETDYLGDGGLMKVEPRWSRATRKHGRDRF